MISTTKIDGDDLKLKKYYIRKDPTSLSLCIVPIWSSNIQYEHFFSFFFCAEYEHFHAQFYADFFFNRKI